MTKTTYFIGIGGAGMSGLAQIMLAEGKPVAGSDSNDSLVVQRLKKLGADIVIGHAAARITDDVARVVYSSVIKDDNPEILQAKTLGLPVISRATLLKEIMAQHNSLAVAGAHGKTTTTGMIATIMELAAKDPTVVIGGYLPCIEGNAKKGNCGYLVAEADESDGSFLILLPRSAVITNIEGDHLDFYQNAERVEAAFEQFIRQIPARGFTVLNYDCPNCRKVMLKGGANLISYGLDPKADFYATDIEYAGHGSTATIYRGTTKLGQISLAVPGLYNIYNALAAIAATAQWGLSFAEQAQGLAAFKGTGRRFEILAEAGGVTVVDDYAHHPTEVAAVLKAAKQMPYQRVIGVFQPHRYSRTQAFAKEFAQALSVADLAVLNEIYSAHEPAIEGVSAQLIVDAFPPSQPLIYAKTAEDILAYLQKNVQAGDLVLVIGAGNIRKTGEDFAAWLSAQNR